MAKEQLSSSPSPGAGPEASRPRFNLLVAEDNLPDALLVREAIAIEKLSVELHMAVDGEQAIAFITRSEADPGAPCPDILLLDLNLPKADGLEVLRRIRASEKFKRLPVLVFSSSNSPEDLRQVASLGAGFFRKVADLQEFMKVGSVLRRMLEEDSARSAS